MQSGISFWKAVTHRAAFTLSCNADPALPPYAHTHPPDMDIALLSRPKRHLIEYIVHAVQAAYTVCIGANPLRGATVVRGDRGRGVVLGKRESNSVLEIDVVIFSFLWQYLQMCFCRSRCIIEWATMIVYMSEPKFMFAVGVICHSLASGNDIDPSDGHY